MAYRVTLSAVAKAALDKETRYSRNHWGPNHAKRHMAELRARIHALKTDAKLYTSYDSALPNVRVMSWKRDRVVYSLDEPAGLVTVLAITSVYQSIESTLKRRP